MKHTEYALLVYSSTDQKINGTGVPGGLAHAKSQAYSILRLMASAAYVDVKPFVAGQAVSEAMILVRISRTGQTVPGKE